MKNTLQFFLLIFWIFSSDLALAAQVTCQNICPPLTELPNPGDEYHSEAYDVSGYDYYTLYISLRTSNNQIEIDTYHGSETFPLGYWTRRWTSVFFLSHAHDEHRLVTPAEWITKTPVRVNLINKNTAGALQIWSAQICFASVGNTKTASVWSGGSALAMLLCLGAGAVLLRRQKLVFTRPDYGSVK